MLHCYKQSLVRHVSLTMAYDSFHLLNDIAYNILHNTILNIVFSVCIQ